MSRYVHAIFCDDVRFEVGNKASFMGVYEGEMFVPSFPVVLKTFVVFASAVTPIDKPFKSVRFELRADEKVIAAVSGESMQVIASHSRRKGPARTQNAKTWFAFAPFTIAEQVILRVAAITEEEELLSVGLEVIAINDQQEHAAAG